MDNLNPVPLVPLNAPAVASNLIAAGYNRTNGQFDLVLVDQRQVPIECLGDAPIFANYVIGKYALTPLAVRYLEQTVANAIKEYAETTGGVLPTIDQFLARSAMPALERLIRDQI